MKRLVVVVLALMLVACGGSAVPAGAASDGEGQHTRAPELPDVIPDAIETGCEEELAGLIDALEELDGRLNIGLNFQDYSGYVGDASVAYERIDIDELGPNCIERVGAPAENALNAYITAYNTWNGCIGDVDCDTDAITPDLQSEWTQASQLIDELRDALDK